MFPPFRLVDADAIFVTLPEICHQVIAEPQLVAGELVKTLAVLLDVDVRVKLAVVQNLPTVDVAAVFFRAVPVVEEKFGNVPDIAANMLPAPIAPDLQGFLESRR